jgi:hypothetical protein
VAARFARAVAAIEAAITTRAADTAMVAEVESTPSSTAGTVAQVRAHHGSANGS